MVSIDTRPAQADAVGPSIRPYVTEEFAWAVALLEATGGRYRVRRGTLVDVAVLPGLVASNDGHPSGLLTLTRHRDELEISVIASAPFDDSQVALLISAAQTYASESCRRMWAICSNADFDVQRALQKSGFRLCTVRPGGVDIVARRSPEGVARSFGGVPVRDEVEFDLLRP
jgi:hypothetical protein